MNKVTAFLREHIWCLLIGIGIVFLGVITFAWAGQDNAIVNYVSFASAIVSIILGVVVIVYSFIQNNSFQQNIYEMRSLIHGIREKTDTVDKGVKSVEQKIMNILQPPETKAAPPSKVSKEKFSEIFNHRGYGILGLIFFYTIIKSYDLKKTYHLSPISLKLGKRLFDDEKFVDIVSGYLLAISHTMQAVYGDGIITDEKLAFKVNFLPDNFRETVEAEITNRLGKEKGRQVIVDAKKIIDDYFSQSQ
jgi:hypothetical protein